MTATSGRIPVFDPATRPTPRRFRAANAVGTLALIRREIIREYKWVGMVVLGPAVQSALFATVFALAAAKRAGPVDGLAFMEFLGAGLVIAALMQRAFETTGYSIMFDKLEADGLQDVLGAPLSPMEILFAYLLTATGVAVAVGMGVWMVMGLFGLGLPEHLLAAGFFMAVSGGIFSLVGLIASIFSPKWDSLSGKETFAIAPLIFLSGTFFPLAALPEGLWRTVFQVNPIYYLVDGFRWAATGRMEADPLISAAVALVLFLIAFAISARLLATGYKIKP